MSADLVPFILASLLVIGVPGPSMLFMLWQVGGPLKGSLAALAGIVLGDLVLIGMSWAGVATLLRAFPAAEAVVRIAGAAYMIWIGFKTWRAPALSTTDGSASQRSNFAATLLITLSNPKTILFFAAFLPVFAGAGAPATSFVTLGLLFETVNIGFYLCFIAGGALIARRSDLLGNPLINITSGVGLMLIGSYALVLSGMGLV